MSTDRTPSWADVVNSSQRIASASSHQTFSWRLAKAKNKRSAAPVTKPTCNGIHCDLSTDSCNEEACRERQKSRLSIVTAENIALASAFDQRLSEIDRLRSEIFETCNTDNLCSPEIDASRIELVSLQKKAVEATFCECLGCQLQDQHKEAMLLNERLAAAQHRLTVLREYCIANDKDTLQRTSSNFARGSKYFTPVGSTKAKGVTALRPTLQMQSSYNVTALTTNSMATRPLKIAWKDKPKTIRIVDVSRKPGRS